MQAEEGHGRCESDRGPRGRSSDGSQMGASDSEVDAAEQMVCMAAGVQFRKAQASLRASNGAPIGASGGGQQWEAVHHGLSRPHAVKVRPLLAVLLLRLIGVDHFRCGIANMNCFKYSGGPAQFII